MRFQGTLLRGIRSVTTAVATVTDGFFNLVSLLLPGNGTNGTQNNTFLDSSTNNFTITRAGNATQGTFTPFSQTGWSNYFDGSGDYLSLPTNINTNLNQIGDWTYEGWIFWNSMPTTGYQNVFGQGAAGQNTFGLMAANAAVNTWSAPYKFIVNQANVGNRITGTTTLTAGNWYHFAVVRSGGIIKLYVNGVAEGAPYSNSTDYSFNNNPLLIGNNSNGYISNFRFVRMAVYTSNFTPPTAPLTAVTGTQLLTCQSNRFVDNSTNNFTVTVAGNTAVQPYSPFDPTAAYSAATVGGSAYFDGAGDYLSIPKSTALAGPADFTFETWIYPTSFAANGTICGFGVNQPTGYSGLNWRLTTAGTFNTYWSTNGTTETTISSTAGAVRLNTWQHVAAARSGSTIRLFVNGVQVGSGTVAGALYTGSAATGGANSYTIGCYFSSNTASVLFTGYMSGFRYTNGTALYTSAFTPPTSPVTAIANTSLLLNYTNAGITDATAKNVLETAGSAQISTAQSRWGGSSIYLDGAGDYLVIPITNAPCQFGTADFTIEAWIYSTAISSQQMILSNRIAATGAANFDWQIVGSKLRFGTTSTDILIGTITLQSNTWYHVAVSRASGVSRMFVNGTLDQSSSTAINLSNNSITHIGTNGTYAPTQYPFSGYINDFRATRGLARYTSAFTPPTAPFALQ